MPGQAASRVNNTLDRTFNHAAPLIFVLSSIVRFLSLMVARTPLDAPARPVEMIFLARSIAGGQGFSNPFGCQSGPTAHLAPVFPYILAIIYHLFPDGHQSQLAVMIFKIIVVSAMYALLPWLAEKLRLERRIGVITGMAGAIIPLFFWLEIKDDWEAPLTALFLVAGLGLLANLFAKPGVKQAVATGLVWGVALLNAPTLALPFAGLFSAWAWQCRKRIAAKWWLIPALLLPLILVLTPWTIRNYVVFHSVFFVRQNLGLELHMAFNPLSKAEMEDTITNGAYRDHPIRNPEVCAQFGRLGEAAMNRAYKHQALGWIRSNLTRSAQLVSQRFVAFWKMPLPQNRSRTLASEALTFVGLLGLGLSIRRHAFAAQLTGIVLFTFPLTYYVVPYFDPRYRYPLEPIIMLLACVFLVETAGNLRDWRTRV